MGMKSIHLFVIFVSMVGAAAAQPVIDTSAGSPYACSYTGDGGPATQATLCYPRNVVSDAAGNYYVMDTTNWVIREINSAGIISTIAGSNVRGTTGDGGPATAAKLGGSEFLAYDGLDHICITDTLAYKIRCVTLSTGIIQGYGTGNPAVAGDGGPWASASFYSPMGLAYAPHPGAGPDLYISELQNATIRKVDGATGIITTIAGAGVYAPLGDGGPATAAQLMNPEGLTYFNNALYVADSGNSRIRRIDLTTGIITTVAGNGTPYFAGDGGLATAAQIAPYSVTFDVAGNMYISDRGNARIRMVNPSGIINTIAGTGNSGVTLDNLPPLQNNLNLVGIYWDPDRSRLYLVDLDRVRYITSQPTTTTLTVSPNPANTGTLVTMTATVTPSGATGTVSFTLNGSTLGSATLSAGQAIYTWTATGTGGPVQALYQGDSNFSASASAVITLSSQKTATTTLLTSNPNPATSAQNVTFTATVTPTVATGSVQFFNGTVQLGTAAVSNGTASFATTLSAGTAVISAVYSGDSAYATSTSANLTQTVIAATTTSVTSSQNPSPINYGVTLTAIVTPPTATGNVQFFDGGTVMVTVPLSGGTAIYNTPALYQGTHPITAVYSGDASNATSTSAVLSQVVKQSPGLGFSSSLNPSIIGQTINFNASVNSAATGTMQISDGSTVLATIPVNAGSAVYPTSALTQGTHQITAFYSGDANYISMTSPPITETVNPKTTTTTAVTSSANPAVTGTQMTFTAAVTPSTATGTVQFLDGPTVLATVTLTNGTAAYSTSALAAGTHAISAVYSGDATDSGSTGNLTQTVTNATTTSIASTQNPSPVNGPVTFLVTVTPASATGAVQFLDGTTVIASATLASGSAQLTTSSLAQGNHSITAVYGGDAGNAGSVSTVLSQAVKLNPQMGLNLNPNPAFAGQTVTLTVGVNAAATGTVQFSDGSTVLATAPVSAGSAVYATSTLAQGAHQITATYSGDANYLSAQSATTPLTINQKSATTTSLGSSTSLNLVGYPVTFTATVSPSTATGSIQFLDGATLLGTVTLTSGSAAYTTSSLTAGDHSITAVYSGDAGDLASTSAVLTQSVRQVATLTFGMSPNPAVLGQTVTITANVTAAATGTIQFLDGSTVLGTVPISSGVAVYVTSTFTQGTHSIHVTYSGDSTYASAGTSANILTVNAKSSTTAIVTSSQNPSFANTPVTLVASVSPATATGNVQFLDGTTVLGTVALTNGAAQLSVSTLAQGSHSITAVYAGDAADTGSTSAVLTQVAKLSAGMTGGLNPNPAVAGHSFTISALMATAATGTVTFTDNGATLAVVNVSSGTASYSTTNLTVGVHTLGISYSGDGVYMAVLTTASETVLGATSIALASNLNPSVVGQAVTFVATVTPSAATGNVQFYTSSTLIATVALSNGTAALSTSSLAQGSQSITANYLGSSTYAPSYGTPLIQVLKAAASVALTSSANPSTTGQSVTFTAAVTPSTGTGTVQFLDGSTVIGASTLSSGHASLATGSLAQGSHSITGVYSGDASDAAASSGALSQVVNASTPVAPSSLTAIPAGASQINLAWTASPTSGVTYDVYASTAPGFTHSASNRIASSVSATSYPATGLAGATTYYFLVTAVNGGGESAASNQASAATSGATSCHVSYSVTSQWNNGFNGAFSIQNTGSTTFTSWNVTWTWPGNQKVTQAWSTNYKETGANISFTNMSYNNSIAPGATLSGMGFGASYSGTNTSPTTFYVNGIRCQ